jgi:hypothetical protein
MTENLDSKEIKNSFLNSPDEKDINIYTLYVERINKHYDLRLQHFKIYFGFNTGLFLIVGYLLNLYLKDLSPDIRCIFILIPFIGLLFSLAWTVVTRKDRRAQLYMNQILGDMEKEIFKEDKDRLGLYSKINKDYPPQTKFGFDIIDINFYMACMFFSIWVISFIFVLCKI